MRARLIAGLMIAGCSSQAADPDPGLHLGLRVAGAQLVRGPLQPENGGPAVTVIDRPEPQIHRGQGDVVIRGRLAPGGVAVHVQLDGDPDHWVKPAGIFDDDLPDELLWTARLELSPDVQTSSTARVLIQAADREGRLGPVRSTSFELLPDPPPSALTFALGWDRPADLDLHVVTPAGVDINPKNINSHEPPPPGEVEPPDAWKDGALLDFDSNQECHIDGRQIERVTYQNIPPAPGMYRVYVRMFAPCGEDAVGFDVVILRAGMVIRRAAGVLYELDARIHPREGEAPGLLVAEILVE